MQMEYITQSNDVDDDQAVPSTPIAPTPRREMKRPKMIKHGETKSKSKSSSNSKPNPDPSGSKGRQFFFVNESSSTKGKRSHVMKHHIREKKRERGPVLAMSPAGDSAGIQSGRSTRMVFWRPEDDAERDKEKEKEAETEVEDEVLSGDEPAALGSLVKRTSGSGSVSEASSPQEDPQLHPQTSRSLVARMIPKSSEADPFDTLPVTITEDMEQLLIVWGYKMAYWSGQNPCIKTSTFKLAMASPALFYSLILSYTARVRDRVERPNAEPRAHIYVDTAERLLAEEMQKSDGRDEDRIILALAGLSLQEERYGSGTKAVQLMQDAMGRLKRRIGDSIAETFLHYIRLTQAPRLTTHEPREATRLISFLRDADTLSTGPLLTLSRIPEFRDAFQFGSPLHFMLAAGPSPTPVPEDDRKWVILNDSREPCRIAALVYIAAALLDNFASPENTARLIAWIIGMVLENQLHRSPSTESLMWLLLTDPHDPHLKNSWRPWFVGNLMEVVCKLPLPLRFHFSEIVLRILMGRRMDLEVSIEKFEGEIAGFVDPERQGGVLDILPWRVV